ncbi:glycoside hydrolase family 38 C-terminal domain-containing protein [Lactococcus garvieae]|uniref:Alpha-mannosidase n=1 Tax=Lactococcus garvieae TaxID=1363 RepID=A0A6L2ZYE7_9LACT|nr:glycoside hydrolase family 38 C-terminal domain-containing protein [Lactococcus garvieae]GFO52557.1 alpha-mannosidase [Lactococcus garvieae]
MVKRVYIVPHTHWDREWYFSLEDSNIMLEQDMTRLIDVLENNPDFPSFVYDGQMSIIDEYLKICPQNKDRLAKLIENKRIFIGPWYTQTDTLLVQTESIIRNLLLGSKGAKEMGHSMNIGYLPDIFGQNAYLPSLFKDFNIDYSILQRGLYNEQLKDGLNFTWKSPDGRDIPSNNIYFGYGPGKFLSSDPNYVEKSLLPILEKLASFNEEEEAILLPAGGDQVLVREYFPQVVRELNEMNLGYEFILSDYETFMKATDHQMNTKVSGELLASQKSRIHNTIRSQRIDIKLLNSKVEEKLYQQLEPLAVMANQLGAKYPDRWIEKCLKLLFDVHAHDSIGGCNSDETNHSIKERLYKIERILDGQINILKKQIARGIQNNDENLVVAFNLLPKKMCKMVRFVLFTKNAQVQLEGVEDQVILQQDYISGGKKVKVTAQGEIEVEVPGYYRTELLAKISFDGFGYKTFNVVEKEAEMLLEEKTASIKNDFYKISVENDQLVISGDQFVIEDFLQFETQVDAGDSYDFSPQPEDEPQIFKQVKLISVKKSKLQQEMKIKHFITVKDLTGNQSEQQVTTTLILEKKARQVSVSHQLSNQMKDHRLRVLFKADTSSGKNFADQGYYILQRVNNNAYLEKWKEDNFAEAPVAIYPLENFAGIDNNIVVYTKGLKEYQVLKSHFALTLYRSVGVLGRDDLAWRPGRASGINNKIVQTPDAQMQGEMDFSYSVVFTSQKFEVNELYDELEKFQSNQLTYHHQELNTFEERLERFELPQPLSMTELNKQKIFFNFEDVRVAAVKKAENQDNVIVRLFNPTDSKVPLMDEGIPLNLLEEVKTQKYIGAKSFATLRLLGEK